MVCFRALIFAAAFSLLSLGWIASSSADANRDAEQCYSKITFTFQSPSDATFEFYDDFSIRIHKYLQDIRPPSGDVRYFPNSDNVIFRSSANCDKAQDYLTKGMADVVADGPFGRKQVSVVYKIESSQEIAAEYHVPRFIGRVWAAKPSDVEDETNCYVTLKASGSDEKKDDASLDLIMQFAGHMYLDERRVHGYIVDTSYSHYTVFFKLSCSEVRDYLDSLVSETTKNYEERMKEKAPPYTITVSKTR